MLVAYSYCKEHDRYELIKSSSRISETGALIELHTNLTIKFPTGHVIFVVVPLPTVIRSSLSVTTGRGRKTCFC